MPLEFKETLKGERLILKRTLPNLELAKKVFEAIDKNREHLNPWFPWVELTKTAEDTANYLFEKKKEEDKGKKVEYGIYIEEEYIGNIGIFDINEENKSAEIGYWLAKAHTRKGYMTEAVKIVEKEFFESHNLNRIQIKCDERNEPSFKVAEKCGYIIEGKRRQDAWSKQFNDFRNTIVLSKLKSEYN